MKEEQLDRLFREKLEGHKSVPNEALWTKISEKNNEKRKSRLWIYHVAASIAIIFMCSYYFIGLNDTNEQQWQIVRYNEAIGPRLDLKKTLSLDVNLTHTEVEVVKVERSKVKDKPQLAIPIKIDKVEKHVAQIQKPALQKIEFIEMPDATTEIQIASNNQTKGKKMVFDISQFEVANVAATEKDKKTGKLKKIIKFAVDVKEGDGALGQLRDAKNSLFASNKSMPENGR